MKRAQFLILSIIFPLQRRPIQVQALARRAAYSRQTLQTHLRILEDAQLLRVDRSERPHSYEITEKGLVELNK
jgi:DNA-binding MarR family transcriptional regulator